MTDSTDRRLNLAPYIGKRLLVEAVLIDIHTPNTKNDFKFGLVFASITLPNEKIELDHTIIPVNKQFMADHDLVLFRKYSFTALVETYDKKQWLCGVSVYAKAFQLNQINGRRFNDCSLAAPNAPLSVYLKNRITRLGNASLPINLIELADILTRKKEGEREQYLNQLTTTLLKTTTVTRAKLLDELYKKEKIRKKQR